MIEPLRILVAVLFALDLALKGVGCWRAARSNQLIWFVAILVINSVGILPLVYLVFFDKDKSLFKKLPGLLKLKLF